MYEDLSAEKQILSMPAGIDALQRMIDNQAYLKGVQDLDEDLGSVDRDMIPATDNMYAIGEINNRFRDLFSFYANVLELTVGSGTEINPSIKLGEGTGLYTSSEGKIVVTSSGLSVFETSGAGVKVKGANSTQILVENTTPGQTGTWSIGSNKSALHLGEISTGYTPKFSFLIDKMLSVVPIETPSLVIGGCIFEWDETNTSLKLTANETVLVEVDSVDFIVRSERLVVPEGDANNLGISMGGGDVVGLTSTGSGDLVLRAGSMDRLRLGSSNLPGVFVDDSFGVSRTEIAGPALTDMDLSSCSKILADTSTGDITLVGFFNATEGQMLYIIKKEPEGVLTVKHDDTEGILLKDGTDFVLPAGSRGGITLSYDYDEWREISRS